MKFEISSKEMAKERDYSIYIVKFFAVFLIINSHADICYPKYSFLATGGAIGDSLFLFCSGYTLFFGQMKRFDNFMKRRIARIYPSSIATIIVLLLVQGSFENFEHIFLLGAGRDFLNAIMVYYVFLWFVRKYFSKKIPLLFGVILLITIVAYWFFPYKYETGVKGIYGITTIFRWIPYLGIMLMGSYLGINRNSYQFRIGSDSAKFFLCLVLFYAIQFASKKYPIIAPFQIVTIGFLVGIVFYFWKVCNADIFKKIYYSQFGNWIILAIGGLCLESYLIQYSILTDKLNSIFPLNLLVIYMAVLIAAYIVRCLARIISQTFRTEDYEWAKIFAIK